MLTFALAHPFLFTWLGLAVLFTVRHIVSAFVGRR
jgi:hypothetical protein